MFLLTGGQPVKVNNRALVPLSNSLSQSPYEDSPYRNAHVYSSPNNHQQRQHLRRHQDDGPEGYHPGLTEQLELLVTPISRVLLAFFGTAP